MKAVAECNKDQGQASSAPSSAMPATISSGRTANKPGCILHMVVVYEIAIVPCWGEHGNSGIMTLSAATVTL